MGIKVEVFSSPGCGKCTHAKVTLKRIAVELGGAQIQWREVDILEEMDYAVRLGVLSTPAIAIDGKLEFTSLPSSQKLRARLQAALAAKKMQPQ